MTTSVDGNQIVAYSRAVDGSLVERNRYATGGRGSEGAIDPLGSQGSLTLSQDRFLLFAVNTATGDLSVFRVKGANLDLAQVASSGGGAPVAVAQHGSLVYVINFASNSNVVGSQLDETGHLIKIPDPVPGLFDVVVSPDGTALTVQTGPASSSSASSVSSYLVEEGGKLSPVTGSAPTFGSAACWIALTPNGQYAYVSNSLSSTISASPSAARVM
jgi:6-phosphogluconolactonase (cycloisomerase 2 family)